MTFTVEYEKEDDGRWLAEVLELPGTLAYGQTSEEAVAKAQALALRVLADRLEQGENAPESSTFPLPQHEPVVFDQSQARSHRASSHWAEHQMRI
jgi:predicted RNase H-like HicB family nuclease